ncbi:hypothetical protein LZ012_09065 [Dechloromonas sp. XY25]|uniref:Uncharacterized protein n=1 Tax=Dechloromonas hankyongensis TaxID=2908002 RepID=A0ABS9K1Z9_9RHOO|nr:hypothetical protein [Dechloromonas hankyongensis]MCG2577146.1 hypothetical protein [Dechloromonas hankyongensis]
MTNAVLSPCLTEADHLATYVAGVGRLSEKLATIAANQRGSERSLGRAAAALRAMAALNHRYQCPDLRNRPLDNENVAGASR